MWTRQASTRYAWEAERGDPDEYNMFRCHSGQHSLDYTTVLSNGNHLNCLVKMHGIFEIITVSTKTYKVYS